MNNENEHGNFHEIFYDESVTTTHNQNDEDPLNFVEVEEMKTESEIEFENSDTFGYEGIENNCDLPYKDNFQQENFENIKTVHGKQKKFKCDTCGKGFFKDFSLKKHIKVIHEGARDHKCPQCEKTFTQAASLRRHIESFHSGNVTVFNCELCQKNFTRKDNLNDHIENVHNGRIKKPYKCDKCDKYFRKPSVLKKHIEIVHEGQMNFKCNYCPFATG